jgi:hypothetical protein
MIAPKCNWTWRSTQYETGHGALKTGVADGPWRFSNSSLTSTSRIPDNSGLPIRHEIQQSAPATTSNTAIAHSLEPGRPSLGNARVVIAGIEFLAARLNTIGIDQPRAMDSKPIIHGSD